MRHERNRTRGEGMILAVALLIVFVICLILHMNRQPAEISAEPVHAVFLERTRLNLNTANAEQLCTLTGIGPVLAERILEYRTAHGGFKSTDALAEIDGIGVKKLEAIRDQVCVG